MLDPLYTYFCDIDPVEESTITPGELKKQP